MASSPPPTPITTINYANPGQDSLAYVMSSGYFNALAANGQIKSGYVIYDQFNQVQLAAAVTSGVVTTQLYGFAPAVFPGLLCGFDAAATNINAGNPSNGDKVSSAVDVSGNGNTWLQATSANQPTWTNNILSGLPAVLFTDNSAIQLANSLIVSAQPVTCYVLARFTSLPARAVTIFDSVAGSSARIALRLNTAGTQYNIFAGGLVGSIPADTNWHVFTVIFGAVGSNSTMQIDLNGAFSGGLQTALGAGGNGAQNLILGGGQGNTLGLPGYIQKAAFCAGVHTPDQQQQIISAWLQLRPPDVAFPNASSTSLSASLPFSLALFGDSLTTASLGYGGQFATLRPNVTVDDEGVGGQASNNIAARMGAIPISAVVSGNSIPASGGVTVTSMSPDPFYHWNSTSGSLKGTISGILGYMSTTSGVYTFTRIAVGAVTAVSNPVTFAPTTGVDQSTVNAIGVNRLAAMENWTNVIFMGYNDLRVGFMLGQIPYSRATLLANIAAAVAGCPRALVMGLPFGETFLTSARSAQGTSPSDATTVATYNEGLAINSALAAAYPTRFFNTQANLLTLGQSNNFTILSTSLTLNNLTLMPDGIHPTGPSGQATMASGVNTMLQGLGW